MVERPARPRPTVLGWGAVLLVVGLLGGWALSRILSPPPDVLESPRYTVVTAEQGTVAQTLRLNTSAVWEADAELANQVAGTVTSIHLVDGTTMGPGALLYTVDLRPVVVAAGPVPAFRDLSWGDHGADVAQVQGMLAALGYAPGDPDGVFDAAVNSAVRAWQRDLGVAVDGVVRRGDLVFVPALPARLALAPEVAVGAVLVGGEPTVRVLPAAPVFSITLPENQARLVTHGMRVDISFDDGSWSAVVTELTVDGSGSPLARLGGVDGGPICTEDCVHVPYGTAVVLPSLIHVVPEVEGVTVPAAAVVTAADGGTGVVLESGEFRPVTVLTGASGLVVVEGIEAGTRVRTPGELALEAPR